MANQKLDSILSGVAGEYLVAGELSRRGYIASITLRNSKGVDVLVTNSDATKTVNIQVKTNQGSSPYWLLSKKAEDYVAENLFYVFVNLNDGEVPEYFVVPSKTVASFIKKSHQNYISHPGRGGIKRKDSSMRKFEDKEKKFLNRWDLFPL